MFMRDVLKYDLDTSGILAAFPYILMAIVVQVKKSHNYLYNQKQSYKQKNWGCSCECWTGQKAFVRSNFPLYPHGHCGPDALQVFNNLKKSGAHPACWLFEGGAQRQLLTRLELPSSRQSWIHVLRVEISKQNRNIFDNFDQACIHPRVAVPNCVILF